jgi:Mg-chelatase subunit ChlD
MLGRRVIFVLSVLLAIVIHAGLYWFAPNITLGRTFDTPTRERVREFRFHLREEVPDPPRPPAGSGGEAAAQGKANLSSRPGSVRDLLARNEEKLTPDLGGTNMAEVRDMTERALREQSATQPDLAPATDSLRRADAKIIEIAREDARLGLDIARRVVRPSPERFFSPDELPALRSTLADAPVPLVRFEPVGESLLAKAIAGDAIETLPMPVEGQPTAAVAIDEEMLDSESVPLPVEIALAPVSREKERAVEETPFQFLDDLVDIKLATYRSPGEDAGYFRVRVALREGAKTTPAPRDIVFLLDASSSFQQRKLDAAVAAVRDALGKLRPADRFNVLLFRESTTPFQPQPVEASEANLDAARAFLKKVPSRGETDVYNALTASISETDTIGRASLLVVLSDGRPTTGLRDAREIINNVTRANTARHAVLVYAGGNAIDRYLLELLAYRNRGAAAFAERIEDMRGGFQKFFAANAEPLLVNVRADYAGLDPQSIFPRELPDLSATAPYEIHGRYQPARDKEFVMRLSGRNGQLSKDLVFKLRFDDADKGGTELASGWAFQKSYSLIAEIAERGEAPELLSELRALGKKHGIRTVYSE